MAEAGFRVHGRVQGVGFRWWTRQQAERLELHGTVRNEADGSVVVHVRGDGARVDEMGRLREEGPPLARVDRVVRTEEPVPATDGFHVAD